MDSAKLGEMVQDRKEKKTELADLQRLLQEAGKAMRDYGQKLQDGTAIGMVGGEPAEQHFDLPQLTKTRKRARELNEEIERLSAQLGPQGA